MPKRSRVGSTIKEQYTIALTRQRDIVRKAIKRGWQLPSGVKSVAELLPRASKPSKRDITRLEKADPYKKLTYYQVDTETGEIVKSARGARGKELAKKKSRKRVAKKITDESWAVGADNAGAGTRVGGGDPDPFGLTETLESFEAERIRAKEFVIESFREYIKDRMEQVHRRNGTWLYDTRNVRENNNGKVPYGHKETNDGSYHFTDLWMKHIDHFIETYGDMGVDALIIAKDEGMMPDPETIGYTGQSISAYLTHVMELMDFSRSDMEDMSTELEMEGGFDEV